MGCPLNGTTPKLAFYKVSPIGWHMLALLTNTRTQGFFKLLKERQISANGQELKFAVILGSLDRAASLTYSCFIFLCEIMFLFLKLFFSSCWFLIPSSGTLRIIFNFWWLVIYSIKIIEETWKHWTIFTIVQETLKHWISK